MDAADRIPIDIGYEATGEAGESQAGQRMTVREDGGLVIDILTRPCDPARSTETEIVVCAASPEEGQLEPLPPPRSQTATEKLGEALNVKVGPLELGSIATGDGTRALGARIRF